MLRQMSEAEAAELLRRNREGRLGCVFGGYPYVVPVGYIFDGKSIYSHSLPGRKITALRADPRACLQVDEIEGDWNWRSVLAFGDYQEITSEEERGHILNDLLAGFPRLTPVESVISQGSDTPRVIVFRLRVVGISGVVER
jgi:uncharacterized protein